MGIEGPKQTSIKNGSEQAPFIWNALQCVDATILEAQPGASHQVAHGLRNQDFTRPRQPGYPRTDMHGDSCQVFTDNLAFAGMQSAPRF